MVSCSPSPRIDAAGYAQRSRLEGGHTQLEGQSIRLEIKPNFKSDWYMLHALYVLRMSFAPVLMLKSSCLHASTA